MKRLFVSITALVCACLLLCVPVVTPSYAEEAASEAAGIENLCVNPYGLERESADTVRWHRLDDEYYLFMPADTDPGMCVVYFDASEEVMFDGDLLQDGQLCGSLAEEGVKTLSCGGRTYTLHVMRSSDIPTVFITTESGSLDNIHADKDNKEAGTIKIYESGSVSMDETELKQIKGRGNTTWEKPKKPYNIKFDNRTSVLGMAAAKKWALLASWYDPSFMRNPYGWELGEAFGLDYSSEYRHVDLYINGEYLGNYIFCENVEIDKNRIDISNLEKANEEANPDVDIESLPRLGTGKNGAVETSDVFGSKKWVDIPNDPDDISGGYLLEHDHDYRYDEEVSGFVTSTGQCVVIKSPEYASKSETEYISGLVNDATEAVYSSDGYNSKGRHYSEYFDMDSLARMYIYEEMAQDFDSCVTSFFMYKPADYDKIVFSPVWDMDGAFTYYHWAYGEVTQPCAYWWANRRTVRRIVGGEPSLLAAVYKHDDFRAQVCDTWAEIKSSGCIDEVNDYMPSVYSKLEASAAMNAIRWDVYGTADSKACKEMYRADAADMHSYIERREGYLDTGFSGNTATLMLDQNGAELDDDVLFNKMPIQAIGDTVTIDRKALDYVFVPEHKEFVCWNTKKDGSGTSYMPGDSIKLVSEETMLYAIWGPDGETRQREKAEAEELEWRGTLSSKIPAVKSVSVRAGSKKLRVRWKRLSASKRKKFDRVEIQVCPDKKFRRSNTIRVTSGNNSKSKTVSKLKKNKKYWVKVRNVKGAGTEKLVSKWSKPKRVRVK